MGRILIRLESVNFIRKCNQFMILFKDKILFSGGNLMVITDQAKAYIEKYMEESGVNTLRFVFEGAGCCSPKWGIALAEAEEGDIQETINGINVAIDKNVLEIVQQIALDFEENEEGEGGLVISGYDSCCS